MKKLKKYLPFALLILLVVVLLSPLASSLPDGLEWVAQRSGFIHLSEDAFWKHSPLPDYQGGVFAGLLGAALVFTITLIWAKLMKGKKISKQ